MVSKSADLVLVKRDPLDATYALKLAKATYNKMIRNLFWEAGYNVIGIPLVAGAVLMSISTVVVSINAILLRRVRLHD